MIEKTEVVNFRTTEEFKRYLKSEAKRMNISLSSLVVLALNYYLKEESNNDSFREKTK